MESGGDASPNPKFFRILSAGFVKKLPLPRAFTKQHLIGEKSTEFATLVNPKGQSWRVHVMEEQQSELHFEGDAWMSFLYEHKLGLGSFLVFTYRGSNMTFDFRAFDLSTFEIFYPSVHDPPIVDQFSSSTPSLKRRKRQEICKRSEDRNSAESCLGRLQETDIQTEQAKDSEDSRLFSESAASESICFTCTIKKPNLIKPYLYIPAGVIRKCNKLRQIKEMTLKDPAGRAWPVSIYHRKGNFVETSISLGWPQFAKSNMLKEDDQCVFEFEPKHQENVMNVQIIRQVS